MGIGYHLGVAPDGSLYLLGNIESWRAHIADLNDRYIGIVLLGDFTHHWPTAEALIGLHQAIGWVELEYGRDFPEWGHKDKAVAWSPTACPGNTWPQWWP